MNIFTLHKQIGQEEVDYLLLKSIFSQSASPRDKITRLLKTQALIRIKKGLYIFGPEYSQKPFSKEILANLIYGPSAISLQYALSFYGMIPERVTVITCVTNKRNKHFATPVGEFRYQYLALRKYATGITRIPLNEKQHILIATPEKALADTLFFSPYKNTIKTQSDLKAYLFEDLRIDETCLQTFDRELMHAIAENYHQPVIHLLKEYLKK